MARARKRSRAGKAQLIGSTTLFKVCTRVQLTGVSGTNRLSRPSCCKRLQRASLASGLLIAQYAAGDVPNLVPEAWSVMFANQRDHGATPLERGIARLAGRDEHVVLHRLWVCRNSRDRLTLQEHFHILDCRECKRALAAMRNIEGNRGNAELRLSRTPSFLQFRMRILLWFCPLWSGPGAWNGFPHLYCTSGRTLP